MCLAGRRIAVGRARGIWCCVPGSDTAQSVGAGHHVHREVALAQAGEAVMGLLQRTVALTGPLQEQWQNDKRLLCCTLSDPGALISGGLQRLQSGECQSNSNDFGSSRSFFCTVENACAQLGRTGCVLGTGDNRGICKSSAHRFQILQPQRRHSQTQPICSTHMSTKAKQRKTVATGLRKKCEK